MVSEVDEQRGAAKQIYSPPLATGHSYHNNALV